MASTIYIWDYILMFSMEVDLVWKSKWNFMKGLYLFQRYQPFIDITMSLYCQFDFLSLSSLIFSYTSPNREEFDQKCLSEVNLQQWRFVKSYLHMKQRRLHFLSSTDGTWTCCI